MHPQTVRRWRDRFGWPTRSQALVQQKNHEFEAKLRHRIVARREQSFHATQEIQDAALRFLARPDTIKTTAQALRALKVSAELECLADASFNWSRRGNE